MHLSIIVPAYNEERNLRDTIIKFNNYLNKQSYSYEIIIVNDGSTDKTGAIARTLKTELKTVRIAGGDINKGKGAAIREGMLIATGDYRLFIDADNATSIDHLDKVWPLFKNGNDLVIGSRNPKDALNTSIKKRQPYWKIILGKTGNLAVQLLAVRGIWDTQCGFKIFSKKFIEDIIPKTIIDRWAIDFEILALVQLYNYKIGIIPVRWFNSSESRVGIKGYFLTLKDLIRIKISLITGKYKYINNK